MLSLNQQFLTPFPLLVVFLLSKISNFWPLPPSPLRRHSLWMAPHLKSQSAFSLSDKSEHIAMAINSHQTDFQYGGLYESHNHSNHLSIVVNLFPPKKSEGPIPHSGLLILLVILLIILETLGNFLLFCMVFYEKYGMDSKKRTITNMLLSKMIFVQILCNIVIMPLPIIGQIFGVYSEYFW